MSSQRHDGDLVREWLDESYEAQREPARFLEHLVDAVPDTPQRRRHWWQGAGSRRIQTPSARETTEYRPSPIQAANGHTPTVIGRTQSMFSPAKAIIAGALVFGIGGALLIAQPFDQQTSTVPGAESDTEPAAPVEFTGRWERGSQMQSEDVTFEGGVTTARGGAWRHTASEVSDPRFDGDVVVFPSSTVYGGGGVRVWNRAYRVQNADGAWQGYPTIGLDILDSSGGPMVSVFNGEGAYKGLDAVVELTPRSGGWDLRGVILDGGLPPAPEAVPFE